MEILFTHYPLGSINFFRKVIRFGFLGGMLMAFPAIYVLIVTWYAPTFCDRVLRIYHLIRLLIFLIQVPLRLIMSSQLSHASRGHDRASVVDRLISLCHSWAWRLNQATGVVVYWMFAFALVFTWTAQHCSTHSSYLYRLCIINIIIFFIHMLLSLNWLRLIVTEDSFEAAMWKRGANDEMIEMYTHKMIYMSRRKSVDDDVEEEEDESVDSDDEEEEEEDDDDDDLPFHQTECSICMCDYIHGQSIRILPCEHNYHQSCIDEWLYKKKACPLCSREIDKVSATSTTTTTTSTSTASPLQAPIRPRARTVPPHIHPHQS